MNFLLNNLVDLKKRNKRRTHFFFAAVFRSNVKWEHSCSVENRSRAHPWRNTNNTDAPDK